MRSKVLTPINLVLLVFFFVYCLISIVNHFCFRTYALDLGAYTATMYDYAHFKIHDCSSFQSNQENILAGHFDLYLLLLSPFSYLFGVYTLLFAQIFSVLAGGLGVYKLLLRFGNKTALIGAIYFLSFFGIFSAISFDYHSNVIASAFIPWLLLSLYQQKTKSFLFFFMLIIISRENISLIIAIMLPCMLLVEKEISTKFKKLVLVSTGFSLLYFAVITSWVMPALSSTGKLLQFKYDILGSNYLDAITNTFSHPIKYGSLLFKNHLANNSFDYIKTELWIFLGLSGGILLLLNFPFLIMLLPVLAQKLFHNQAEMWGINDHYSAEFAPILTVGIFYTLNQRSFLKKRIRVLSYAVLLLSLGLTVRMMDNPNSGVRRDNVRIYKPLHYTSVVDRTSFNRISKLIPDDASVSCQGLLHPHFAWRDKIYMYPTIKDASYILLYRTNEFWPLNKNEFENKLSELEKDPAFEKIADENDLVLFKRLK